MAAELSRYILGSGYSSGSGRQVIHAIRPVQPRDIPNGMKSIQQITDWACKSYYNEVAIVPGSRMHFYRALHNS